MIGDRLPPFPLLAERLRVTVKLLRLVIPIMAAEGLLEVVPHVGTFCRRLPEAEDSAAAESRFLPAQPVSSAGEKTHIRLYVSEYDETRRALLAGDDACVRGIAPGVLRRDFPAVRLRFDAQRGRCAGHGEHLYAKPRTTGGLAGLGHRGGRRAGEAAGGGRRYPLHG